MSQDLNFRRNCFEDGRILLQIYADRWRFPDEYHLPGRQDFEEEKKKKSIQMVRMLLIMDAPEEVSVIYDLSSGSYMTATSSMGERVHYSRVLKFYQHSSRWYLHTKLSKFSQIVNYHRTNYLPKKIDPMARNRLKQNIGITRIAIARVSCTTSRRSEALGGGATPKLRIPGRRGFLSGDRSGYNW